ncbi:MAG: hypothetical protein LUH40_01745, partial [Clostridiales bacterium]|nr:hypothetical protein [Clostridiales bacterium]
MAFADIAASVVRGVSKGNARTLKRKMTAPPIAEHLIKEISADCFHVGFSKCDVMPDDISAKSYWMAGNDVGRRAESVHDPITVSAMWVGCGENGGVLMVSADCIGITNVEVCKIRDMLAKFSARTECKNISVCCTHNHAGFDTVGYWGKFPKTGKDDEYMDKLLSSVVNVCKEAYENRKAGKLFIGSAHVPQAQLDSRPPTVLHDTLTRLRFVPDDGSEETWFLNFAANPNALGRENRAISADYPYYIRRKINEYKTTNVLFGVGAVGAVESGEFSEDMHERAILQGECLANAAIQIENDRLLDCHLKILRQPFYCPVENSVFALSAALNVASSKRYPYNKGDLKLAFKTEMTYMILGDQKILFLPLEIFPETVYGGYSDASE